MVEVRNATNQIVRQVLNGKLTTYCVAHGGGTDRHSLAENVVMMEDGSTYAKISLCDILGL